MTCCAAAVSPAQAENNAGLDARQEAIVPIAAFAAGGDLEKLKHALNAGLTVNEIKEILVQLYAYAGFPRSLKAMRKPRRWPKKNLRQNARPEISGKVDNMADSPLI